MFTLAGSTWARTEAAALAPLAGPCCSSSSSTAESIVVDDVGEDSAGKTPGAKEETGPARKLAKPSSTICCAWQPFSVPEPWPRAPAKGELDRLAGSTEPGLKGVVSLANEMGRS